MKNVEKIDLNELQKFLEKFAVREEKDSIKYALKSAIERVDTNEMGEGKFFRILLYHLGRDFDLTTCKEIERAFVKKFNGTQ